MSRVEYNYETMNVTVYPDGTQGPQTAPVTWGNVSSMLEYSYGTGSPGPLWRKTVKSYLHTDTTVNPNANQAQYLALNIADRPTSETVLDGSGNTVSQTKYYYDEGTLTSTSNAPAFGHDYTRFGSSNTIRGNLTRISRWNNQTGSWLDTKYAYDDLGNRVMVTDPKANQTSYSYTDEFSGACGNPSQPTYAYQTMMTDALGLQTKMHYSLCTGLVAQVQDPNDLAANRSGTSYTRDLVNNIVRTDYPDSGWQSTSFGGYALPIVETTQVGRGGSYSPVQTSVQYDSFGRKSVLTNASGATSTIGYDLVGNIFSKSNFENGSTPNSEVTSFAYDALGRVTITCDQGNGTYPSPCVPGSDYRKLTYADPSVTEQDEAGNTWVRRSDAFGNLVSVVEPGSLTTNYTYSVLNDLASATQNGLATEVPRVRAFKYDSLSRLIDSCNPETTASGKKCDGTYWSNVYTYDANGNVLTKTDANGMAITYTYDALNRMLTKSAPDRSTAATFSYDTATNGKGRLAQQYVAAPWLSGGGASGTRFNYDPMGRVSGTNVFRYSAQTWEPGIGALYDLAGNITQLTYPDGRIVQQGFDTANRLSTVTDHTNNTLGAQYFGVSSGQTQYLPSGALENALYGNGVTETFSLTARLQPLHASANSTSLPTQTGLGNIFDRSLVYGTSTTSCGSSANNGSIYAMMDHLLRANNQSFCYDSLNRITSVMQNSGWFNQSYGYDSFGNVVPHDNINANPSYSVDPATNRLAMNGTLISGNLQYDSAGYTRVSPFPGGGVYYDTYTAEGYLRGIGTASDPTQPTAYNIGSYLYDADGNRTFAAANNGPAKEYVYFNGQPVSQLDDNGVIWTDYIYANGQRIATATSIDAPIHLSGVNCSNCSIAATYVNITAGRLIQSGDVLSLSQYSVGGSEGGVILFFTDGTRAGGGTAYDSDGQQINCDGLKNQWHRRHVSLSAFVGKTLSNTYLLSDVCAASGAFNIYFDDVAIGGNGTTTTIYSPHPGEVFSPVTSNATSVRAVAESNTTAPDSTVHYYLADYLSSTQLQLSNFGWPVWQGEFTPFGEEVVNGTTLLPGQSDAITMHYKFTGKERDNESGLDYFGARYYGSSMGRFMSPDGFSDGSSPDNPQSWNLYSYVQNNPLTNTDPDGHDCVVQSRTSNTTESVTTSSGNCDNVSVGDGQTKTYVAGTVTSITANGGNSIDIGYNSYDGQSSGVTNAGAAPIPDNPGLAYNWGNNAQGYQQLGAASRLVKDATIAVGGTYAVLGAAGLATGVLGGEGAGLAGVGRSGASIGNRLWHIFGNPEHGLGALVAKYGSQLAAYSAILNAAQAQITATGNFVGVAIQVGGMNIQVNGTVIDGVVKISTAYIAK